MGENVVGQSVRRPDLVDKVTGAAEYCVDVTMPGMAHAKVVRSDRAHARITGIDVDEALAAPGVVAVVTADDISSLHARFGHIITDHWILATDKVRYYGEPVAVVVAETVAAAADAVELVRVSYQDLPAVMDVEAALADGAPLVHEQAYEATGDESFQNLSHIEEEADGTEPALSNIAHEVTIGWGDVDAAFAASDVVVENTVYFPMLYAYAMEPYNAVASYSSSLRML